MGQPHTLRRLNRRQVMATLLTGPPLTRPQLAHRLGLSKVTVSAIVRELLARQLVLLQAQPAVGGGRIPQAVQVNPAFGTGLALDLQPDQLTACAVSVNGTTRRYDLPVTDQDVVAAALSLIQQVRQQAPFGPLLVLVIGLPAAVDSQGQIGEPNALTAFDAQPLLALARHHRLQLIFENDANLVALAQQASGAPTSVALAAVIDRPGGLGVGLILGGQLYRGPQGRAGELGQSPWPTAAGPRCLEQLPPAARLDATGYALAGLVVALNLERLVLTGARADELARRLADLMPGLSLTVAHGAAASPLTGAALHARALIQHALLDDWTAPHVA
jgi:ROK family/MarR family